MKRKFKAPRGFYRELRGMKELRRRIKAIEFWIEHAEDKEKDIRFYVYWNKPEEIAQAWDHVASVDKEGYKDHTWLRHINQPRTRKQKAIYKSQLSGIKHLSEIL